MGTENNVVAIFPTEPVPLPHPAEHIIDFRFPPNQDNTNIRRGDFPDGFVFGSGTGAYQVEGAAGIGGRGPSVWDDYTMRTPGKITDGCNGNVACDMYNRYKDDIRMMKQMGFDAYRFSLSWTRILPGGRACAGINREGIKYYNDLIDTVIDNGMKPYVTIFHFDLPDCLEKEYGGFLNKKIVDDFREYAELCFWAFGDRVAWWTTINEPWTYAVNGYVKGTFPPGQALCPPHRAQKKLPAHRSVHLPDRTHSNLKHDNVEAAKDAYTVTKHLLLSHAAAVDTYRRTFKDVQKGQIGIVLNSHWHVPYDKHSEKDRAAVGRALDFMLGWFLEPVLYGRYPQTMIDNVPPENLGYFSPTESDLLKGSVDYVGLNYYTTTYAKHDPNPEGVGYDSDQKIEYPTKDIHGKPIGDPSGSDWLFIVPWGLYAHLVKMVEKYPNLPPIYITENGVSDLNDISHTAKDGCDDLRRAKYHQDHLAYLQKATEYYNSLKLQIKGYFIWSWCDNFEWMEGYTARFGITYIDYMNNNTRHPKSSALWFNKFLKGPKSKVKALLTKSKRQHEDDSDENNGVAKRPRDAE